jgi:hypothetical protein
MVNRHFLADFRQIQWQFFATLEGSIRSPFVSHATFLAAFMWFGWFLIFPVLRSINWGYDIRLGYGWSLAPSFHGISEHV